MTIYIAINREITTTTACFSISFTGNTIVSCICLPLVKRRQTIWPMNSGTCAYFFFFTTSSLLSFLFYLTHCFLSICGHFAQTCISKCDVSFIKTGVIACLIYSIDI